MESFSYVFIGLIFDGIIYLLVYSLDKKHVFRESLIYVFIGSTCDFKHILWESLIMY